MTTRNMGSGKGLMKLRFRKSNRRRGEDWGATQRMSKCIILFLKSVGGERSGLEGICCEVGLEPIVNNASATASNSVSDVIDVLTLKNGHRPRGCDMG